MDLIMFYVSQLLELEETGVKLTKYDYFQVVCNLLDIYALEMNHRNYGFDDC